MRQAFAGMLWSKQFYFYPVDKWMSSDILPPDCAKRVALRNKEWFHLESADILSMPEYPWFDSRWRISLPITRISS